MNKVLGIITEYNPFHNGHLYHLKKSKEITNCDYTICIMSGNFTQRGSCSLIDKWSKANMAIANGVDLVIELPVLYATSSAENFAYGSIKILNSLKIVNDICFGSECSDINILNNIADIFYTEPKEWKAILTKELKKGISFPKARQTATLKYLISVQNLKLNQEKLLDYENILHSPNNILGIEYIKALKKIHSHITPYTIKRTECNYNSTSVNGNIASSTAIREIIKSKNINILPNLMPESSYQILAKNIEQGHIVTDIFRYEKEILYTLRKMDIAEISCLPDVTEGLENILKKAANSCNNLIEFLEIVKSKRYTSTRIQRILLYCLIGITKNDMELSKKISPYVRVLAMNQNGKHLLSKICKTNPTLDIITSVKKFEDSCTNEDLKQMLGKDIEATNIYTLGYTFNSKGNLDYTKKI